MIYFDNAATTRPIASIEKLAQEYYEEKWYNPSAMYPVSYTHLDVYKRQEVDSFMKRAEGKLE